MDFDAFNSLKSVNQAKIIALAKVGSEITPFSVVVRAADLTKHTLESTIKTCFKKVHDEFDYERKEVTYGGELYISHEFQDSSGKPVEVIYVRRPFMTVTASNRSSELYSEVIGNEGPFIVDL